MAEPSRLLALPTEILELIIKAVIDSYGFRYPYGIKYSYGIIDKMYSAPILKLRLLHPVLLPLFDKAIFTRFLFTLSPRYISLSEGQYGGLVTIPHISRHIRSLHVGAIQLDPGSETAFETMVDKVLEGVQASVEVLTLGLPCRLRRWLHFDLPDLNSFSRLTTLSLYGFVGLAYLTPIWSVAQHLADVVLHPNFHTSDDQQYDYVSDLAQSAAPFHTWRTSLHPLRSLELYSFQSDIIRNYFLLIEPKVVNLQLDYPVPRNTNLSNNTLDWVTAPYLDCHLRKFIVNFGYEVEPDDRSLAIWDGMKMAWKGKSIDMTATFLRPRDNAETKWHHVS